MSRLSSAAVAAAGGKAQAASHDRNTGRRIIGAS
jgi:hypothetical protein